MVEKPAVPLIRWPGGKRGLISQITSHLPTEYNDYYEPFFGGGALFFSLKPSIANLSDVNVDLIGCYETVRDYPEDLVEILLSYPNTEDFYYKVRAARPEGKIEKSARLLYLTRLAFNGIYRVNLKGEFNVPYGRRTHLATVDKDLLLKTSGLLQGVGLKVQDFEKATINAGEGDLVYFDPPYTVAHANNGFVKYNEKIFSWADQVRLAGHARNLAEKGCYVVVSNADHFSVDELYSGFKKVIINRHSVIAASSAHRRQITECLYVLGG
jgi:DNA adenine methylase